MFQREHQIECGPWKHPYTLRFIFVSSQCLRDKRNVGDEPDSATLYRSMVYR